MRIAASDPYLYEQMHATNIPNEEKLSDSISSHSTTGSTPSEEVFLKSFEGYEEKTSEEKVSFLKHSFTALQSQFTSVHQATKQARSGEFHGNVSRFQRMHRQATFLSEKIEELPTDCTGKQTLLEQVSHFQTRSYPSRFLLRFDSSYEQVTEEGKLDFIAECAFELQLEVMRLHGEKASEDCFEHIEKEIHFLTNKVQEIPSLSSDLQVQADETVKELHFSKFRSQFLDVFYGRYEQKTTEKKIEIIEGCLKKLEKAVHGSSQSPTQVDSEILFLKRQIKKLSSRQREVYEQRENLQRIETKLKKLKKEQAPVNFLKNQVHQARIAEYTYLFASESLQLLDLIEEHLQAFDRSDPSAEKHLGHVQDCYESSEKHLHALQKSLRHKKNPLHGMSEQQIRALREELISSTATHLRISKANVRQKLSSITDTLFTGLVRKKDAVLKSLRKLPQHEKNRILQSNPTPSHKDALQKLIEDPDGQPDMLSLDLLDDLLLAHFSYS